MENNVTIQLQVPQSVYNALQQIGCAMKVDVPTLCTICIGAGLKSISKKKGFM